MRPEHLYHPDFVPEPFWWEAARPGEDLGQALPRATEFLVIGAGYAGLHAALELARAGRSVCVVEAQSIGHGASTRNGGAVGIGPAAWRGPPSHSASDLGILEGVRALAHLEATVRGLGIQCHYERSGRFVGAFAPDHYARLGGQATRLNALTDAGAEMVPRERQWEEIGSDFYHGGLLVRLSGKLHPALYHRGLAEACRTAGAVLCARAAVVEILGRRGRFSARTAAGEVGAQEVIVATNGYTGSLTPWLRERLVPMASYVIATEEIPQTIAAMLVPRGRTLSETARLLHYYRLSPDGRRVLFGGRARLGEVHPNVAAPILYRRMLARLPALRGVRITHAWSGRVAFTADRLAHAGEARGLHYCAGCNGSGVAMLGYLGQQIARRASGAETDSAFLGRPFERPPVPGYDGRPWFLPLIGGYFRARDALERGAAR